MDTKLKIVSMSLIMFILFPQNASPLNTCPKCGEIEVPQPFSTGESCGDPKYKLQCNDENTLEFPSAGGFCYSVVGINTTARTLTIRPPEMEPDECVSADFSLQGLRLEDGSPFNVSARNTVMLFNCSEVILRSPLNCSENSFCRRFEDETMSGCRGTLCCHYLKDSSMNSRFIRVRPGGCSAYTSVVDIQPQDPVRDWNYGIELQWLPPS